MKVKFSFKVSIVLLITMFVNTSCSKDNVTAINDLTGNWKVVYFLNNETKITKTDENTWPETNNGDITANFTETGSDGIGTISGITVSNTYNGQYIILSDTEITIGPITTTEINEPEWTDLFLIGSAQKYEIKNSRLFIYYNDDNNVIVFERI